ncbi:hypothetical protein ABZX40_41030 [Streptomyces sp. NPDC004610]|uniref:hypothetical protein n=1 Tax=unclassified Streptomyces TaxID=2593676 RepID=UPI0033B2D4FB
MSLGDDHGYGDSARGDASDAYGGSGSTRTRLPESGAYGSGRRGGRTSSRSLVTVVGVVVLLIAAIAFANRGGDDSADDSSPGTAAAPPGTAPTAPSGTDPVDTTTNGIPTGYARTEQGAQSAAANFAVALGSTGMYATNTRRSIVNTVYAPDVAESRGADIDSAYSGEQFLRNIGLDRDGTAPDGQSFVSRVIPVGTKVTGFSPATATVEVWYSSLFGLSGEASVNPVTESWFTATYQLTWADDWKITDFQQKDGPVPVARDQRASTAEDMTKAVEEYGGFTYAR